jgi:hypothetical protein
MTKRGGCAGRPRGSPDLAGVPGLSGRVGTAISLAKWPFHNVEFKSGAAQQLFSLWKNTCRIVEEKT